MSNNTNNSLKSISSFFFLKALFLITWGVYLAKLPVVSIWFPLGTGIALIICVFTVLYMYVIKKAVLKKTEETEPIETLNATVNKNTNTLNYNDNVI